jgi:hypothetical protein
LKKDIVSVEIVLKRWLKMSITAEQILKEFESLPDSDKREVASEILRRVFKIDYTPLSDDELIMNAEAVFLELDQREIRDERPEPR